MILGPLQRNVGWWIDVYAESDEVFPCNFLTPWKLLGWTLWFTIYHEEKTNCKHEQLFIRNSSERTSALVLLLFLKLVYCCWTVWVWSWNQHTKPQWRVTFAKISQFIEFHLMALKMLKCQDISVHRVPRRRNRPKLSSCKFILTT